MYRLLSILSILILTFTSCSRIRGDGEVQENQKTEKESKGECVEDLTYFIHKYVAEKYDEQIDLHLCYAMIRYKDGRYGFWADFTSMEIMDVPNARRFIVDLVEGITGKINQGSRLVRSGQVTLQPSDIYVSIEFESFYGVYVDPLYVGRAELKDGYLTGYYAHTSLDPDTTVFQIHFEPYLRSVLLTDIYELIERERDEVQPYKLSEKDKKKMIQRSPRNKSGHKSGII